MNFRRPTLLFAALASFLPAALPAQDASPAPAAAALTIEECIARALQRNFTLEAQRFGPQIAKDQIDVARDGFTPTLTASTSRSEARTAATAFGVGTKSEVSDTRASVTQRFYTGTTASVTTVLDRSESNPAVSGLNPAYNADVSVSVRQQLLQGFGTAANRAVVDRARLGYDRANLDYKVVALDVIQSTERAYYSLAFAREQLEVRKFSLALAQRLYDEAKTRRDTGVATDLDVLQAEVGVANARRAVLLAEQAVKDSEESLLALIGQFELDATVGAVRLPDYDGTLPVFASVYDAAKRNQPDYLSAQTAVEQAKLDLVVAKDGAKPSLSVGGALGFDSRRTSGSSAINHALEGENKSWQVDLSLSYPIGQVGDRARYRQNLATVSQQTTRLRQLEQNIEVNVRAAVRSVETSAESVKISTQARDLSEKQYELEKAKFDAGLSTSRRVLEAQNDLETARVAELQSKVDLRNAISALRRIEGSGLQRYGVTLP